MLEILLLIGFLGVFGGSVVVIAKKGLTSRRFNVNPELEAPEPRRMIVSHSQRAIRAEVDQTPEWWDSQFHAALEASDSRSRGLDKQTIDGVSY